ncbi:site-specific integrase [Methylomonas sp. LW13]|uniref:tyrosine-type recombinase/integrase n=1 Tax=unclassified Methylomonas TaxID=2608980 RepID=UPI00051B86BF|nr:site-specific integrase [Methylomonas sp. LW13]QBC28843.1 site-specific integrase [Methylomonas sp. LW13]
MAYIRPLANGNFRADVRLKGIVKNKTFPTESLAQAWADNIENGIKTILNLDQAQLIALSEDEICALGGEDLFKQLGIDLFAIHHQAKLEAINALSKKELLQLSVQEIERMGGAELFIKAGKRIRYKTFRDVCDEYLSRWGKKDYQGQMQRVDYWCQFFGDRIMTDIDIFDIREHIDDLIDEGQRATTINRKKAVLSSVYKFALSRGYVDENLVRSVVVDDDTKRRDRVLSEAERKRLLKACRESHWDKLYLLVVMAMTTGARKGELMNLRWSDVNFKDSSAFLGDTKNGTSRELYLAPVVMTELKRHQEVGTGLIFPSVELPEQPMDFRKAWRNVLKAANIADRDILNPDGSVKLEKFTFHCLRHGFCSALSDSGKEINQIAKLAGHKSIQTTMRYIHQGRDQKRQIVNELAQAFNL